MAHIPSLGPRMKHSQTTSASGGTAVVTLAAQELVSHRIHQIHHIYNGGTPGTKAYTIVATIGGSSKTIAVGNAHTVSVTHKDYYYGNIVADENTAVTITGAALTSQTNTLDVFYS